MEWYINGAADRFLTSEEVQDVEYDEETTKLNLNSFL